MIDLFNPSIGDYVLKRYAGMWERRLGFKVSDCTLTISSRSQAVGICLARQIHLRCTNKRRETFADVSGVYFSAL